MGLAAAKGYELIITEKPSTAAKIASALADGKPLKKSHNKVPYYELSNDGKDIVVASAVGHLYTVAEKDKSYAYPSYDVEWQLTADVEKNAGYSRKYAQVIKNLAKDASSFTVATDYDIEGETIGLNIIKYLAKQKDANRMKFSTVTASDLVEAYKNKQPSIDWGQANAGTTRHILDWLYGINVSRALSHAVKAAGGYMVLSAGRVQGPALKIVVEREKEIQAFVPEDYWQIILRGTHQGKEWEALHEKDRFTDESEASQIVEKCGDRPATVKKIESKQYKQQAPNPFNLGDLQSEAYRQFGIKPKDTLSLAQNLYSNAYISYPRTSSQKLPPKIGYRNVLQQLANNSNYKKFVSLLLEKKHLKPNEGQKSDPAHPAIYPTGEQPHSLKGREEKIYDLIVKRFLATFGDPATRQSDTVHISIEGETFLSRGKRTIEPGWHVLYRPYVKLKEEELPAFKENENVQYSGIEKLAKQTQPPKRYTPSSLVSELEKRELGTKATRADIVESLIKRSYVEGGRNLEVTKLGMKIYDVLERTSPEMIDEELTAHFEEELDQIRANDKKPEEVLEEARVELDKIIGNFKEKEESTGKDLLEARRLQREVENSLFACPTCGGTLTITYSKKNKNRFIGCDNYPECEFTAALPQQGKIVVSDKECEHCGWEQIAVIRKRRGPQVQCINPDCPAKKEREKKQKKLAKEVGEGSTCEKCAKGTMVMKKGRYGMFLACDEYPECKNIVNIPESEEEAKKQEEMKEKAKEAGEGKQCPECNEGELMLRKSKRGYFLGCSRYPKCKKIVKVE